MKALQSTNWRRVCARDDLVPNAGVCALLGERQVAIFYLPGENPGLYAIDNWDPIGNAAVLYRGILSDIGGELVVASPLYKQHFSLNSGQCLEEEGVSVPIYEVALDGDTVVLGE